MALFFLRRLTVSKRPFCPFARRLPEARRRFDGEGRGILIDHLCWPCPACWRNLHAEAARHPVTTKGLCDDPFLHALRRIGSPSAAELSARHRQILDTAGDRPLGFAHLMLEEGYWVGRDDPRQGVLALRLALVLGSDPDIRAFRPPHNHALLAHAALLLADLELRRDDLVATRSALEEAREHLLQAASRLDLLAEIEIVEARWLDAQRRFSEARRCWAQALALLEAPWHDARRNELILTLCAQPGTPRAQQR